MTVVIGYCAKWLLAPKITPHQIRKKMMTYNAALINISIAAVSGTVLKSVIHNHNSPQKKIDRGKSRNPITANIVKTPISGFVL